MGGKCEEYFGEKSTFQSIFLLTRYVLSVGIFLLPWGMKYGGIIAGPLIIAALIIINAYRSHVIRKLNYQLLDLQIPCPAGCSDWWLLESSVGKVSKSRINALLGVLSTMQWISLLGHAAAFLAFSGTSFSQVYSGEESSVGRARLFTVLALGVVVIVHPVSQLIRNAIHTRFPDSTHMTSFFLLIFLPSMVILLLMIPVTLSYIIPKYKDPVVTAEDYNAYVHLIPLLISATLFVVGGTPDDVTGTLRDTREDSLCSVSILISQIIMIVVGIGFSIAVYFGFKNETCGSVTFQLPFNSPEYDAIRVITGITALVFVSFRHQIEPKLAVRLAGPEVFCDIMFKVIFLCIAGGIAIAFPNFAGLACLFGSVTSIMMTFIFPFFCDLCFQITGGRTGEEIEEDDEGKPLRASTSTANGEDTHPIARSVMRMIRDVIFIVLGIVGIVVGLISTIAYVSHVSSQMKELEPLSCIK